ncbi:MAG: nitroreductase family protein, partial [Flammeovirgaceae bacterium]
VALAAKNWSSSGKLNSGSTYDTGLAVGNLTLQAQYMGLFTHQMGGFVTETLRKNLEIPEDYEICSVTAVGYIGNLSDLPEPLRDYEVGERQRKNVSDIAFTSRWGNPYN